MLKIALKKAKISHLAQAEALIHLEERKTGRECK